MADAPTAQTSQVTVAVPSFEVRVVEGKDVIFFRVTCTNEDGTSKSLYKTLEEFQELDKWVTRFHKQDDAVTTPPDTKLPHVFKPYIIRQLFIDKTDLNESRAAKLNDYLKGLQAIPEVFSSFPVQLFLRLHNMSGKVVIVTGANTGIGKITARWVAELGGHVILACRSAEKAAPVVQEIREQTGSDKVESMSLDLASLQSVRDFVAAFEAKGLPLHVLVNNAGLAGATTTRTVDGFETHMGVNHLGMFLLTELLKAKLIASAPSRIIIVSSKGHEQITYADLDWSKARNESSKLGAFRLYQISKLANSLYAVELAHQLKEHNVSVFHTHPGAVKTDVWRALPGWLQAVGGTLMISAEEGALTSVLLAVHPGLEEQTGLYYNQCFVAKPNPAVLVRENRLKCLEESARLVGLDTSAPPAAAAAAAAAAE